MSEVMERREARAMTSADARHSAGLYRRLVFRALRRMRYGLLIVKLPDGSAVHFGRGGNPRGARFGTTAKIDVAEENFFRRCVLSGDIGLAEGYMAGEWTSEDPAAVVAWFILNASPSSRARRLALNWLGWLDRAAHRLRGNSLRGSRENIAAHYDLSNDLFSQFLDPGMTYSSAIFATEETPLEEAQLAKIERLCALLELQPGMRVLEIGGGWGALSRHIAKRYGCHVTSITISNAQYAWAARRRDEEGLAERIDLRLTDYRQIDGSFDRIVSVEMIEAVGHDYLEAFFGKCDALLAPNGLLALQAITFPDARYDAMRRSVDFIQKHIFPGGLLPSIGALVESARRTGELTLLDLHDFGPSYARTLECWSDAFELHLDGVRALGFDEVFVRKWRYYFAYCIAAFRMRHVSVVQMLFSRPNNYELARAVPR